MPQRTPGYVIFIKFFEFLSPNYFATLIVGTQLIFGLFAVHFFMMRLSATIYVHSLMKLVLFALLLFPFFPPLLVANNICSEGLSYPLYLLFLIFTFDFLHYEKKYSLIWLLVIYMALNLTRGQFMLTPIIIGFLYFFKHRKHLLKKHYLLKIVFVCAFPFILNVADRTYHRIKDGLFISTPYTYVNVSAATFYISQKNDAKLINDEEHKQVFEICHNQLSEKGLLMSNRPQGNFEEYYNFFHNNFAKICNQTVHDTSAEYYSEKSIAYGNDIKAASVYGLWQSELFCKTVFKTILKQRFKEFAMLYYKNLIHGFKSVVVLIVLIVILFFSGYKTIVNYSKQNSLLFLLSALTISNALIVSLACHSILRYLFYNYISMVLIGILLINAFRYGKKN